MSIARHGVRRKHALLSPYKNTERVPNTIRYRPLRNEDPSEISSLDHPPTATMGSPNLGLSILSFFVLVIQVHAGLYYDQKTCSGTLVMIHCELD